MSDSYFIVENGIEKGLCDPYHYHHFCLDNGMEVVLVSDDTADVANVSMSVAAGSLYDPTDVPGLAHFVEHLLFMGTEKHPVENEYNSFLSQNNGSSNAYTSAEYTDFFFSVANNALFDALDLFSGFFTCPLFLDSCVQREISAVDNEHSKNLQSDVWRSSQLIKHISRPDHSFNHFYTGNKSTLSIPTIRERAIEFHKAYYLPSNMKLVVQGGFDVAKMQCRIQSLFGCLENRDSLPPQFSEHVFGKDAMNSIYHIIPVGTMKRVEV